MNWKGMIIGIGLALALVAANLAAPPPAHAESQGGESPPEALAPLQRLTLSQAMTLGSENWLQEPEFRTVEGLNRQRERETWRRLWLPALTFQQTTTSGNLRAFDPERQADEPDRQVEARLDYLLYTGGRDRADYRASLAASAASRQEERLAREVVRLQVAEAFLALLSAGRRVASLRLAVEQAGREHRNMQRRQSLGTRTELEVMQARLVLADEQFNLDTELRERVQRALELSHLLRRPVSPTAALEADVRSDKPLLPLDRYQQTALRRHGELAQLAHELERAGQDARREEASDYPELLLTTAVVDPEGEEITRSVALSLVCRFGGHRANVDRVDTNREVVQSVATGETFGIERTTNRFGVTFFDFRDSTATQGTLQAQARLEQHRAARLLVEAREARLREVQNRYHALLSALARLDVERMRVRKNTLERNAYRRSYESGNVPYEDVVERQTALTRSQLTRIDAETEVLLSWIGLAHESGMPLAGPPSGGAGFPPAQDKTPER